MRHSLLLAALLLAVLCPGCRVQTRGVAAPKPLYVDPVHGGAADPVIVQSRRDGLWYMFYTNRRADLRGGRGAEWVHGSPIGIATSPDLANWT